MTPLEQLEELKKEIIENDNCDDSMSAYDLAMSILPRAFDLGRREQHNEVLKAIKNLYDNWTADAVVDPDHNSLQRALSYVAPREKKSA